MMQDQDERFAELLREDAPAERDALFRISVLERRERVRFQQRSRVLLVAAVVVAFFFGVAFGIGADLFITTLVGLLIAGLAAAFILSVPGVMEMKHRFGSHRKTAGRS
jgi:hypothetical protein